MTTDSDAYQPHPVDSGSINPDAEIPYDLTPNDIVRAMGDFIDFLGSVNEQLYRNDTEKLETILQAAGLSSLVGEFVQSRIPVYCDSIVQNAYHNGHPDLLPAGRYSNDSCQVAEEGIEVKASRYSGSWQGHNPESVYLMVFVYQSNNENDREPVRRFRFKKVVAGTLDAEEHWSYSGRSEGSRRTITASVLASGRDKMNENWIYRDPDLDGLDLPPA